MESKPLVNLLTSSKVCRELRWGREGTNQTVALRSYTLGRRHITVCIQNYSINRIAVKTVTQHFPAQQILFCNKALDMETTISSKLV